MSNAINQMSIVEIEEGLLALPDSDRAVLADILSKSVNPEYAGAQERALSEMLNRRSEEIRTGQIEPVEGEVAMKRIEEMIKS